MELQKGKKQREHLVQGRKGQPERLSLLLLLVQFQVVNDRLEELQLPSRMPASACTVDDLFTSQLKVKRIQRKGLINVR